MKLNGTSFKLQALRKKPVPTKPLLRAKELNIEQGLTINDF